MSCHRCRAPIKRIIVCLSCNSLMHRGCVTRYAGYEKISPDTAVIPNCPACNSEPNDGRSSRSRSESSSSNAKGNDARAIDDDDSSDITALLFEIRDLKQEVSDLKQEITELKSSHTKSVEKLIVDNNNLLLENIKVLLNPSKGLIPALKTLTNNENNVFTHTERNINKNKNNSTVVNAVESVTNINVDTGSSTESNLLTLKNSRKKSSNKFDNKPKAAATSSRQVGILGTADDVGIQSAQRRVFYHVYNCAPNTTVDKIRSYISNKIGISDFTCTALTCNSLYSSFKVSIVSVNTDTFLSPEKWPKDVSVRPFINRRKKHKPLNKVSSNSFLETPFLNQLN